MNLKHLSLALLTATTLIAGCGSGSSGGSGTPSTSTPTDPTSPTNPDNQNKRVIISGVVALGSPLKGAAITIIGRTSQGLIDTSATGAVANDDGTFSISVPASWKPPLLLEATANAGDRTVVLHSIYGDDFLPTTSRQTINITSYTEAIFAAATGQHPATFYRDMGTTDSAAEGQADAALMAGLTAELITAKHIAVRNALADLIMKATGATRPDSINLITGTFDANHTGIDKALDMTSAYYSSDRSKLLLTNKANQTAGITIALASKTVSGNMPDTVADTIETISQMPAQLEKLYATSIPASSDINKMIASNYMNNSTDAAGLKSILNNSRYIGAQFSIVNLYAIYQDSNKDYRYEVLFKIRAANNTGTAELQRTTVFFNKTTQQWQFIGNGRQARTDILSFYSKNQDLYGKVYQNEPSTAGLILRVEQPGVNNLISKAVISGPGLNGSKTLIKSDLTKTSSDGINLVGCGVLSLSATNCQNRVKFDSETEFQSKDFGFNYNVALYRNASDAQPFDQYTVTVPIKPYLSTDVLPTLAKLTDTVIVDKNSGSVTTSPTLAAARNYVGGDLPIYWTDAGTPDSSYQYFVGMDVDVCFNQQLYSVQASEKGDFSDTQGNRLITLTTDHTKVKTTTTGGYQDEYRAFPNDTPIINAVRRDLRVFAQDEYDRVYYSSYTNALTPPSCQ